MAGGFFGTREGARHQVKPTVSVQAISPRPSHGGHAAVAVAAQRQRRSPHRHTTFLIVLIEFEAPLDDKSRLYSPSNHHVHSPSKSKQLLSQHPRRKKEQANLGVPTYNFGAPTQLLSVGSFNSFTLISHNHFYSVYFFSSLGVF